MFSDISLDVSYAGLEVDKRVWFSYVPVGDLHSIPLEFFLLWFVEPKKKFTGFKVLENVLPSQSVVDWELPNLLLQAKVYVFVDLLIDVTGVCTKYCTYACNFTPSLSCNTYQIMVKNVTLLSSYFWLELTKFCRYS